MAPPRETDRRAMLAKVHIARKEMGLESDTYRDVLQRVCGVDSASDLDHAGLDAVLAEFTRLGWKPKKHAKGRQPPPHRTQAAYIRELWASMRDLVSDPSETALRAFCKRQTKSPAQPEGIEEPRFMPAAAASKVIEGLKGWKARELHRRRQKGRAA